MLEMDALTDQMGNAHLNDTPNEPECLPFFPPEHMEISLDSVPRFLFRIATPFSDGETNETWVHSQSASEDAPLSKEDIFTNLSPQRREDVAGTLNKHLRWWPKDGPEDNFVSWTSSLLFALRYIYYRYSSSKDGSSLEDIKLCVVDTTRFPRGTFVCDLDLIEAFRHFNRYHSPGRDLENLQRMRKRDYYFGEYLSQGSLKVAGKCQIVSADVFFDGDRLHHVQPLFERIAHVPRNIDATWANVVRRDREAIWTNPQPSEHLFRPMMAVDEIAAKFGPEWKFPMAVYLAALVTQARKPDDGEQPADDNDLFMYFRSYPSGLRPVSYLNFA
ncbi:hypothetical protein PHISP_03848 [Aspergillus sp. HF37]|nr:hypothetical protein PHISP_03848 [Aspergillus sp. HF37]